MLSVRMSSTPILHTLSRSLSLSSSLTLSLSLFISPPLSLSHSFSSIFSCLLLHNHTNTLAHTPTKRDGGWGGDEMHELSFNKGER